MMKNTNDNGHEPREPQLDCKYGLAETTLRDDALAIYAIRVGTGGVAPQLAAAFAFDAARVFQEEERRQKDDPNGFATSSTARTKENT